MQEAAQIENPFEIESAAVTDRGLNQSRLHNEDSYLDLPEFGIFAVADGVGGAQAGEVASQMAIETLSDAFGNMPDTADSEDVMRAAVSKANEAIFEMASQLSELAKMATTIAALHIKGDVATIGHVGDSRVYRFMPDGRVVQETLDHSIVAEEVRAGRMTEEQAANHPSRNIISRALGAEPSVEIDLKTVMIEPGTSFLLCSDGITRHVNEDEMLTALRSGGQASNACALLKDLCYERGAEDNLTAVVVRVGTLDYIGDSSHEIPYLEDDAEDTVASARFGYGEGTSEVDLSPAARFEIVDNEPETIEFAPEPVETAVNVDAPAAAATENDGREAIPIAEDPVLQRVSEQAYTGPVTQPARSSLTLMLGSIGLLIAGILVGLGVYYYWDSTHPPVAVVAPAINEMKTTDIPLTTFEESRRLVDQDPRKYIAANPDPQEAQDYFLLGRAYLLTGEYFQARNAFNTAKSRISELDPRDRQTISNEIDMALAVIASGPASERFTQSVANSTATSTSGTSPNTNR
jgi:serine/threonine protein phosphatase PrpC